ncbi:hypothetical protein EBQ90_07460 [bacterium]|nr:hypothetical protein [bacterium]
MLGEDTPSTVKAPFARDFPMRVGSSLNKFHISVPGSNISLEADPLVTRFLTEIGQNLTEVGAITSREGSRREVEEEAVGIDNKSYLKISSNLGFLEPCSRKPFLFY